MDRLKRLVAGRQASGKQRQASGKHGKPPFFQNGNRAGSRRQARFSAGGKGGKQAARTPPLQGASARRWSGSGSPEPVGRRI